LSRRSSKEAKGSLSANARPPRAFAESQDNAAFVKAKINNAGILCLGYTQALRPGVKGELFDPYMMVHG
jgi:hypothetical protein